MTGSRKYNFKCQSFPNTIEQERRRRGWTVTKLAELSGVSRYSINRLLQVEPNPYMSAFDMLYKLFTHYYLYNNAFAYLQRDERGQCVAVFPLNPVHAEFLSDTGGALYVRFIFSGGREVILPYGAMRN